MNKKYFALFSLVFILSLAPLAGFAMTIKSGSNLIVNEDIKGNFFGGGNLVVIESTVNGDVFVAGNSISIKGTINGDVFAAGSSIDVSGTINGNLRAAGSDINIKGRVERNILAAGSNLIVDESAFVGGNITFAGASFLLQGPVGSEVNAAVQNVVINSQVNGDVNLLMDSKNKQSQLSLLDKAIITGNLNYKAVSEAEIKPGAKILGQTNYTPLAISKEGAAEKAKAKAIFERHGWVARGFGFVSLFLAGLLLIYLLPRITDRIYGIMKQKPWSDLGIGLVAVIITPILGVLLLITVVSIPLVLVAFALFTIMLYFAKAMVALAVGRWLAERFNWNWHKVLTFLLGLVIFYIAGLIPFVGWLACFLAVLWAFGAILRVKMQILKELR